MDQRRFLGRGRQGGVAMDRGGLRYISPSHRIPAMKISIEYCTL
jgi:hypothetical protein